MTLLEEIRRRYEKGITETNSKAIAYYAVPDIKTLFSYLDRVENQIAYLRTEIEIRDKANAVVLHNHSLLKAKYKELDKRAKAMAELHANKIQRCAACGGEGFNMETEEACIICEGEGVAYWAKKTAREFLKWREEN